MGFVFHETGYGKRFFENQVPSLFRNIERLAITIENRNKIKKEEEENVNIED